MEKNEETQDLKVRLKLKNDFAKTRYNEQVDLSKLRHKLAMTIIEKRDAIATKRYNERIKILTGKY